MPGRRAGRAEDRHLSPGAIRAEDLERVPQLAERAAENLQVAACGLIACQLVGRLPKLLDQIGVAGRRDRLCAAVGLRVRFWIDKMCGIAFGHDQSAKVEYSSPAHVTKKSEPVGRCATARHGLLAAPLPYTMLRRGRI